MKISQKVIDNINCQISDYYPETGGILGSRDGTTATDVIIEKPLKTHGDYCRYEPDVSFFNTCIAEWQNQGITFIGLFHTHFANVETLSDADRKYIITIMSTLPDEIDSLFFPIFVLPKRELKGFCARREHDSVTINEEKIEIV